MSTRYSFQTLILNKGALKTILLSAFILGVADGLAAIVLTWLNGRPPIIVFQYIASGVLGPTAFAGGLWSVSLGVIAHFFIALAWTVIFFILHPACSLYVHNKILKSVVYGLLIWAIMNMIILPLSRVPSGEININQALTGIAILIVAAGIPLAFSFDRYFFKT